MNSKASLAITVLNEETTIEPLLRSIASQTRLPDDIVIVDGGSTDETVSKITRFKKLKDRLQLIIREGMNRPAGRNLSIEMAKHEIIAITDAGCQLDAHWFERIIAPFSDSSVEIVSGFYRYKATSVFEKCLASYVLTMPDKANPVEFLPSTRSMAIQKSIWREARGFPENYALNEDYVFAIGLKKMGKRFHFVKNAIVYWLPRRNVVEAFHMFYAFAKGDAQARILRPKVLLTFGRYLIGLFAFLAATRNTQLFLYIFVGLLAYVIWAIAKNYTYVRDWRAIFILPILQLTADVAVLSGTIAGTVTRSNYGIYKSRT